MNHNSQPTFTPYEPTELDRRLEACVPGEYPWDDWERQALTAGVNADMAGLGRSVMREACQQGWCDELLDECGATDSETASAMFDQAITQPALTASRWRWLLATDGLRFDPWDREGWPERATEWFAMRRRYEAESAASEPYEPDVALQLKAGLFIEEFHRLDPLALIDLKRWAIRRDARGHSVLWGDFTVLSSTLPRRLLHSGVVRMETHPTDPSRNDATIFEEFEEGSP